MDEFFFFKYAGDNFNSQQQQRVTPLEPAPSTSPSYDYLKQANIDELVRAAFNQLNYLQDHYLYSIGVQRQM